MLEHELGRSLPAVADLTQGLLAWISQLEDLEWVSAVAAASLLRSESTQWIRDELGSRFAVRLVIEFGGVFDDLHPALRFCVIHLSKTEGTAFLAASIGSTPKDLDQLVRAAKQFFAGEKPETGFEANVGRKGRWAVSLYDPELDKLEERLSGIGPTKPLSEVCTILRGLSIAAHQKRGGPEVPLITRLAHVKTQGSLSEDVRKDHPLASSIVGLQITAEKRGFGFAIGKLITAKNAFKHDRGPGTEDEFESATKDLQQTLDACVKALLPHSACQARPLYRSSGSRMGEPFPAAGH